MPWYTRYLTPMTGVLDQLAPGSRIAVVRLRSMGDCVLTTPALEILKNARPDLRIAVVVEPRFAAIFEGNPAVSAILTPSLFEVARWRPALCLNLHGGRWSRLLTLASRARVRAGFAHHVGSRWYTARIPRAQEILGEERPVHTAEHLASTAFYLGCPRQEIPRARLFAAPPPAGPPYAVVHATAAARYKTWCTEGFLAAAERLARTHGLEPVFIGSAADDLAPYRQYRTAAGAPLGEVMSLISGASLFVGNDSGPAHVAAAFGVPVVVLFGRVEHRVTWAPWKASEARTLVSPDGIRAIETEDVLAAIDDLAQAKKKGSK
jgi:ADP-heptose:LPS heptosyltransferase